MATDNEAYDAGSEGEEQSGGKGFQHKHSGDEGHLSSVPLPPITRRASMEENNVHVTAVGGDKADDIEQDRNNEADKKTGDPTHIQEPLWLCVLMTKHPKKSFGEYI